MKAYQSLTAKVQDGYQKKVTRQVLTVKPNATEEDIDNVGVKVVRTLCTESVSLWVGVNDQAKLLTLKWLASTRMFSASNPVRRTASNVSRFALLTEQQENR
jgi:hypothetical protein